MKKTVYLKISENRLVIISGEIIDKDYHLLMSSDGPASEQITKTFCIGYLWGFETSESGNSRKPINDEREFY